MKKRTAFFLSDQTGVTAETLGHSLLVQFDGQKFRQVTLPFIDTEDKARAAVKRIDEACGKDDLRPIVFSTLVQPECRKIVRESRGLHLDIFDAFLESLETELQERPSHKLGQAHGMSDIDAYMKRIEATNYALANDDGGIDRNYDQADVILVGVSRSGKTPTCLYLALHFCIRAANYPITEEDFETGDLPEELLAHKHKIFALTIDPERLAAIRELRRPGSDYASLRRCHKEVQMAEDMFHRYGLAVLDSTTQSIEELASLIKKGL